MEEKQQVENIISESHSFYGKFGRFWVSHIAHKTGKVHFSVHSSDRTVLDREEMIWVKENIPNTSLVRVTKREVEIEENVDEIIF